MCVPIVGTQRRLNSEAGAGILRLSVPPTQTIRPGAASVGVFVLDGGFPGASDLAGGGVRRAAFQQPRSGLSHWNVRRLTEANDWHSGGNPQQYSAWTLAGGLCKCVNGREAVQE